MKYEYHKGGHTMNQTQNEIEIKKRVYFFMHEDRFRGKDLEPIILIDNEKIYTVMVKKKFPRDMYYFFDRKKYLKIWLDEKENILIYFNNWSGDLFISNPQKVEYISNFDYTAGSHELVCGQKKKLILEGFDIIELAINQFTAHEVAIFYILCNKLS